jgi:hypothetical protein
MLTGQGAGPGGVSEKGLYGFKQYDCMAYTDLYNFGLLGEWH